VLAGIGREAGLSEKTLQAFSETREGDAALVGSEERLRGFGVQCAQSAVRRARPGPWNGQRGHHVHALDQALFPVSEEATQETPTLH
jgi:hypothetical protein